MDITLDQARTIVDGALAHGHATDSKPLTVVVLDRGGHPKAVAREDGSGILRPQIATGKAYVALGIGLGSRALARRIEQGPVDAGFVNSLAAISDGRAVPVAGGVLVRDAGGTLIGAVGISGDTSDRDEECALAGVTAAGLAGDGG